MSKVGFPAEVVEGIKDSIDCNIYFFDNKVSLGGMYVVMVCSVVVLIGLYILLSVLKNKRAK